MASSLLLKTALWPLLVFPLLNAFIINDKYVNEDGMKVFTVSDEIKQNNCSCACICLNKPTSANGLVIEPPAPPITNASKQFIIKKMIRNNDCSCACSCVPDNLQEESLRDNERGFNRNGDHFTGLGHRTSTSAHYNEVKSSILTELKTTIEGSYPKSATVPIVTPTNAVVASLTGTSADDTTLTGHQTQSHSTGSTTEEYITGPPELINQQSLSSVWPTTFLSLPPASSQTKPDLIATTQPSITWPTLPTLPVLPTLSPINWTFPTIVDLFALQTSTTQSTSEKKKLQQVSPLAHSTSTNGFIKLTSDPWMGSTLPAFEKKISSIPTDKQPPSTVATASLSSTNLWSSQGSQQTTQSEVFEQQTGWQSSASTLNPTSQSAQQEDQSKIGKQLGSWQTTSVASESEATNTALPTTTPQSRPDEFKTTKQKGPAPTESPPSSTLSSRTNTATNSTAAAFNRSIIVTDTESSVTIDNDREEQIGTLKSTTQNFATAQTTSEHSGGSEGSIPWTEHENEGDSVPGLEISPGTVDASFTKTVTVTAAQLNSIPPVSPTLQISSDTSLLTTHIAAESNDQLATTLAADKPVGQIKTSTLSPEFKKKVKTLLERLKLQLKKMRSDVIESTATAGHGVESFNETQTEVQQMFIESSTNAVLNSAGHGSSQNSTQNLEREELMRKLGTIRDILNKIKAKAATLTEDKSPTSVQTTPTFSAHSGSVGPVTDQQNLTQTSTTLALSSTPDAQRDVVVQTSTLADATTTTTSDATTEGAADGLDNPTTAGIAESGSSETPKDLEKQKFLNKLYEKLLDLKTKLNGIRLQSASETTPAEAIPLSNQLVQVLETPNEERPDFYHLSAQLANIKNSIDSTSDENRSNPSSENELATKQRIQSMLDQLKVKLNTMQNEQAAEEKRTTIKLVSDLSSPVTTASPSEIGTTETAKANYNDTFVKTTEPSLSTTAPVALTDSTTAATKQQQVEVDFSNDETLDSVVVDAVIPANPSPTDHSSAPTTLATQTDAVNHPVTTAGSTSQTESAPTPPEAAVEEVGLTQSSSPTTKDIPPEAEVEVSQTSAGKQMSITSAMASSLETTSALVPQTTTTAATQPEVTTTTSRLQLTSSTAVPGPAFIQQKDDESVEPKVTKETRRSPTKSDLKSSTTTKSVAAITASMSSNAEVSEVVTTAVSTSPQSVPTTSTEQALRTSAQSSADTTWQPVASMLKETVPTSSTQATILVQESTTGVNNARRQPNHGEMLNEENEESSQRGLEISRIFQSDQTSKTRMIDFNLDEADAFNSVDSSDIMPVKADNLTTQAVDVFDVSSTKGSTRVKSTAAPQPQTSSVENEKTRSTTLIKPAKDHSDKKESTDKRVEQDPTTPRVLVSTSSSTLITTDKPVEETTYDDSWFRRKNVARARARLINTIINSSTRLIDKSINAGSDATMLSNQPATVISSDLMSAVRQIQNAEIADQVDASTSQKIQAMDIRNWIHGSSQNKMQRKSQPTKVDPNQQGEIQGQMKVTTPNLTPESSTQLFPLINNLMEIQTPIDALKSTTLSFPNAFESPMTDADLVHHIHTTDSKIQAQSDGPPKELRMKLETSPDVSEQPTSTIESKATSQQSMRTGIHKFRLVTKSSDDFYDDYEQHEPTLSPDTPSRIPKFRHRSPPAKNQASLAKGDKMATTHELPLIDVHPQFESKNEEVAQTQPVQSPPLTTLKPNQNEMTLVRQLEEARRLREKLAKSHLHDNAAGAGIHFQSNSERRHQIEAQMIKLAEAERLRRILLEKTQLNQRVQVKVHDNEVRLGSTAKLRQTAALTTSPSPTQSTLPSHCQPVLKFLQIYQVEDRRSWIHQNCQRVKQFYPSASCSQIESLLTACFQH